jgi:hypothetical protein
MPKDGQARPNVHDSCQQTVIRLAIPRYVSPIQTFAKKVIACCTNTWSKCTVSSVSVSSRDVSTTSQYQDERDVPTPVRHMCLLEKYMRDGSEGKGQLEVLPNVV